ncbi:basic proline-rich protein-like isoform X1 [Mustela erminea]|uniref:basic proline-rich protein-like isoform X1 n=1 Tax=Mustela erminea TaxID=36723 RepID=UPI001386A624|nr:basic proline-rich protein-like isoform X1 [Mustela erminea]
MLRVQPRKPGPPPPRPAPSDPPRLKKVLPPRGSRGPRSPQPRFGLLTYPGPHSFPRPTGLPHGAWTPRGLPVAWPTPQRWRGPQCHPSETPSLCDPLPHVPRQCTPCVWPLNNFVLSPEICNLDTSDVRTGQLLAVGAAPGTVGGSAASLASTHRLPVAPPPWL